MNQLEQIFRDSPTIVDGLVEDGAEVVSFGRLTEALAGLPPPRSLDAEVERRVTADPLVGGHVARSYLGVLTMGLWEQRHSEALPPRPDTPTEWITFVRGARSGRGVTLPQDSSSEARVSLFTEVNGSVRRISIDRPTERDASVSLALERRCAPADFGVCLEGACGCVSRQVHGPDAVVCECGDGTPA